MKERTTTLLASLLLLCGIRAFLRLANLVWIGHSARWKLYTVITMKQSQVRARPLKAHVSPRSQQSSHGVLRRLQPLRFSWNHYKVTHPEQSDGLRIWFSFAKTTARR